MLFTNYSLVSPATRAKKKKDAGTYRRDQTPIPLPVPAALPVHRPTQPLLPDQLRLHLHHLRRIIADHQPRRVVVAPTRTNAPIILHTLTPNRKSLVVIHAHLPTPLALALIGGSRAVGISKASPVQRHTDDELLPRHARGDEVSKSVRGAERRASGVARVGVPVRLVAGGRVPAAGIVVRHQVPEIQVPIHGREVEAVVVLRAGGRGDGEQVVRPWGVLGRVAVERVAGCFQEED